MERSFSIAARDGKRLYVRLRPVEGAPVAVMVHGLTGNMDEHLHYNGARELERASWSSLRFNLYDWQPDARKLVRCTVARHAADLDDVLRFVRDELSPPVIAVIGHSLGGMAALQTSEPFDRLVLWDAAHAQHAVFMKNVRPLSDGVYRLYGGTDALISREMVEEVKAMDSDARIAAWKTPLLVVSCSDAQRVKAARRYLMHAAAKCDFEVIPDSDHTFALGESAVELHRRTVAWLKRQ